MDKIILSSDMDELAERLASQLGGTWTWDVLYPPYRHILYKDGTEVASATYLRQLYAKASAFLADGNAA